MAKAKRGEPVAHKSAARKPGSKSNSAAAMRAALCTAAMCMVIVPDMAAAAAPEQPPFFVLDCGSGSDSGMPDSSRAVEPDRPDSDRARALAFAALGEVQPPLSLSGRTLMHLGERYLPFRYVSGGEVVAYVHTDTQSIHSTTAMRAAQANGTNPEALTQRTNRERYVVLDVTIGPHMHKQVYVHRLLVAASLGVSHESLIGLEVDHKNRVRGDNANITNLQLLTSADHKAKTGRTTVEANRAARADSAAASAGAVASDAEADAEAPPSTAPHPHVNGRSRTVARTGKDGATTFFVSATAAAASVGGTKQTISNACTAERDAYGFMWRYTETPEILALLAAADAREAVCRGTGWRDLVLPDGTKVPGYRISYNLVVRSPSGAHVLGTSVQGGRARKFMFQDTKYYTYALGCASWYGPRPPRCVVMHANDCYDNVTAESLSWGTQKQNMTDAHGRPVFLMDAAGVSTTYTSWGTAAERLGMTARALEQRMMRNDWQSVQVKGYTVSCGASRKRRRES